ncbi:hypothetical protein DPMN_105773 [Dreissena polymorpha]|uniref:Uncharacterized protein n=1 Tax=Dreissena polymorpha TaxID=45954 RepID=A0A9D4QHR8_DREPO|nr:hypothetical protein DPMN_105773 [Dreissena polymorpha]
MGESTRHTWVNSKDADEMERYAAQDERRLCDSCVAEANVCRYIRVGPDGLF